MSVVLNISFKILGGVWGGTPMDRQRDCQWCFFDKVRKTFFLNGLGHVGHPWSERAIRIGFEILNISLEVSPTLNMHDMLDISVDESPPYDIDKHPMWHVNKYL